MKDFFTMTRHERMGSIVILMAIALLLVASLAMRTCGTDEANQVDVVEMKAFEAEADSAVAAYSNHNGQSRHKHDKEKKSRKPRAAKKKDRPRNKPDPVPRKVDPVPQF